MNRFIDNNIGEMFNDILNDVKDNGLKSLTADDFKLIDFDNLNEFSFSWKMLIPIGVIVLVVIISVIIKNAGKRRRESLKAAEDNDMVSIISKEIEMNPKPTANDPLYQALNVKAEAEETRLNLDPERKDSILDTKLKFDEPQNDYRELLRNPKDEEKVVINQQKIEIVSQVPSIKYGAENNNTTRSGRVFTEEELKEIIRK